MHEALLLSQLQEIITYIPFNRELGLELHTLQDKEATLHFSMQPKLIGNYLHQILHGGVIASVLDMAGGIVVIAEKIKQQNNLNSADLALQLGKASTADLQVSFIQPGKGISFYAHASLLQMGNRLAFTRMELLNNEKSLIASASGTYHLGH